jgi:DNA-binding transcriptional ArsR family regulator
VEFDRDEKGNALAACRRLHAAVDALDQAAADLLGVSRNDLRCINALEHGPLPPSRIALQLGLTSGSVTALIDRLEAKGLAARARDPDDRRGVLVSATPRVFESVGVLYRSCAEQVAGVISAYPVGERTDAIRHIDEVAQAWAKAADQAIG